MSIKIALAGNPNCGKTTLFNNLTGSNQYVGNWPGVTVEKKEGKLKGEKDVIIQDLPGIYSLSPYTLEEVVSRTYLVKEKPDAILNIIDGTNIERNLYLTTQLIELGIPVVMAVNMIDLVRKNGDKIDLKKLSAELGCQAVEISALKGEGTEAAAKAAMAAAKAGKAGELPHVFTGSVEHAIAHIEESIQGKVDDRFLRWYAVKLFERDGKVQEELKLSSDLMAHIDQHIKDCEAEMDDDAESIIWSRGRTGSWTEPPGWQENWAYRNWSLVLRSLPWEPALRRRPSASTLRLAAATILPSAMSSDRIYSTVWLWSESAPFCPAFRRTRRS